MESCRSWLPSTARSPPGSSTTPGRPCAPGWWDRSSRCSSSPSSPRSGCGCSACRTGSRSGSSPGSSPWCRSSGRSSRRSCRSCSSWAPVTGCACSPSSRSASPCTSSKPTSWSHASWSARCRCPRCSPSPACSSWAPCSASWASSWPCPSSPSSSWWSGTCSRARSTATRPTTSPRSSGRRRSSAHRGKSCPSDASETHAPVPHHRRRAVRAHDLQDGQLLHPLHARAGGGGVRPRPRRENGERRPGVRRRDSGGGRLRGGARSRGHGRAHRPRRPADWRGWLRRAIEQGLEIWSGLHTFIGDDPELGALARARGVRIFDARKPPAHLPVADGRAAEVDAYVVATVGSDCNVGKMTAQVELRNALRNRGARTRFVATGQTGIFIEGWGIAVDAVVADFIAGASEWLVLEAAKDADIILVEGQGSLIHPGYSGVTLGLLHGCCPDALILCHQASRQYIGDYHGREPWVKIPPLAELVEIYERAAAPVRPTKVIGICLNTYDLSEAQARDAVDRAAADTGLPTPDPVRFDAAPLVEAILQGAMAVQ